MDGKTSMAGAISSSGSQYRCLVADRGLAVVDTENRGFFLPDSETWDDRCLDQPEICIPLSEAEVRELCDPARPVASTHYGPKQQDKASNQDFALSARIVGSDSVWGFGAVADGVSLKTFWPERASRIATLVAYKFFRKKIQSDQLRAEEPSPTFLKGLATELAQDLERALSEDRQQLEQAGAVPSTFTAQVFRDKIESSELWYNTTLLVAVFGPGQGLVLYVGDGGVALVKQRAGGTELVPIQQTDAAVELDRFISLGVGADGFRGRWIRTADCERAAIFLSSDGLDRTLQQNGKSYEKMLSLEAYDNPRVAWSQLQEQHQNFCRSDRPAEEIEPDNSSLALLCWPPWATEGLPAGLPELRRIAAKELLAPSPIRQDPGAVGQSETGASKAVTKCLDSPSQPSVDPDNDFRPEEEYPPSSAEGLANSDPGSAIAPEPSVDPDNDFRPEEKSPPSPSESPLANPVPSLAQNVENADDASATQAPASAPQSSVDPQPTSDPDDDFQSEERTQVEAGRELASRADLVSNDDPQPGSRAHRGEESHVLSRRPRQSPKALLVLLAIIGLALLVVGWQQSGQDLATGQKAENAVETPGEDAEAGSDGRADPIPEKTHAEAEPEHSRLSIALADNPELEGALSHEEGAIMNPALFEELVRWADWLHAEDSSQGNDFTVVAYSDRAPGWQRSGESYCEEVRRLTQRRAQRFAELLESVARDFQIYAEQNVCELPEGVARTTSAQARRLVLFRGRPSFNCTCTVEGFPSLQPSQEQGVVVRQESFSPFGDGVRST